MNAAVIPEGNQRDAVESDAVHLLVVAPPGCGKTEVLAMRAEFLVREGRIRPHRKLLAITYSKRARDNMAQRIETRLGYQTARRLVTVLNFHGLAGRIVRAHGSSIQLPSDTILPTKRWFAETVAQFADDWPTRRAAEQRIHLLKKGPISDDELIAALEGPGDEVALAVEKQRIAEGRLDYADLLRHAQRLVRIPGVARLYQEHFDALVIDEFQDLSLQQLDIVSRVCVRNATYVGDPLQGIYSWAGAEPDEVQAVLETRCSERVDLNVSYRSSPEVLALVNAAGVPIGATALTSSDAARWGSRGRSRAYVFQTDATEATGIAAIAKKLAIDYPDESIGVIARSGFRRKMVDEALIADGTLPLQFWDMALDSPGMLGALRTASRGIPHASPLVEQLGLVRERLVSSIGDDDVDAINELDDALTLLATRATVGEGVRDVLSRFRAVDVSETVLPGVHVLNAHIGKGQQFDWVIVIGLEDGHVPDFRNKDDPEERRVLMVMLSRAKRGLIVTRAKSRVTNWGEKTLELSRWWNDLADASERVVEHGKK